MSRATCRRSGSRLGRTTGRSTTSPPRRAPPPSTAPLSAFTTAWSALNIIGRMRGGHPVAVWWVPALQGDWRYDVLLDDPAAPALDPASITAYVTPWNAMSIVGRNAATGEPTSYWWAPETNVWTAEALQIGSPPRTTSTAGHDRPVLGGSCQA